METPECAAEPIKILRDIIMREMDLPDEMVMLYNQPKLAPTNTELYVWIGFVAGRAFGNSLNYESTEEGLVEVQGLNQQEVYSINLMSYGDAARRRKHEVMFALGGTYAQHRAEKFSLKFGEIPRSFIDISSVEGAQRLNRYTMNVPLLCAYSRRRVVEYFDTFPDSTQTILIDK